MDKLGVLLGADSGLFGALLREFLGRHCRTVDHEPDGPALVRSVRRSAHDVVILDISLPKLVIADVLRATPPRSPAPSVVVLSPNCSPEQAAALFRLGAVGYFPTRSTPEELLTAINAVAAGKTYVTPDIAGELVGKLHRAPTGSKADWFGLTARQREVLGLIGAGCTTKEIASRLGISRRTAEFHRAQLQRRLGLDSGSELLMFAVRTGLNPVREHTSAIGIPGRQAD